MSRINLTIDSHRYYDWHWYHDIQASSTSPNCFDSLKRSSWKGDEIRYMIWTLAVNFTLIIDCSKDNRTTMGDTASDAMVKGTVWTLCEFSLLVSQENHFDLSLTALDDAVMRLYNKKGDFKNRTCRSLWTPKLTKSWYENCVSYECKRLIQSVLQWQFRCMMLKWLVQQSESNFRCTWIEPHKRQQNGQMLICRGQRVIEVRNPSGDSWWRQAFRWIIPTSWVTTIAGSWD